MMNGVIRERNIEWAPPNMLEKMLCKKCKNLPLSPMMCICKSERANIICKECSREPARTPTPYMCPLHNPPLPLSELTPSEEQCFKIIRVECPECEYKGLYPQVRGHIQNMHYNRDMGGEGKCMECRGRIDVSGVNVRERHAKLERKVFTKYKRAMREIEEVKGSRDNHTYIDTGVPLSPHTHLNSSLAQVSGGIGEESGDIYVDNLDIDTNIDVDIPPRSNTLLTTINNTSPHTVIEAEAEYFATCTHKRITIWNHSTFTPLFNVPLPHKQKQKHKISAITSINNGEIAIGTEEGEVIIWDVMGREEKGRMAGGSPCRVLLSFHGVLLCGGDDAQIYKWSLQTYALLNILLAHTGAISAFCPIPGGQIFSGGDDGLIIQWDVETGETLRIIGSTRGTIYGILTFGPLLYVLTNSNIYVLNLHQGDLLHKEKGGGKAWDLVGINSIGVAEGEKGVTMFRLSGPEGGYLEKINSLEITGVNASSILGCFKQEMLVGDMKTGLYKVVGDEVYSLRGEDQHGSLSNLISEKVDGEKRMCGINSIINMKGLTL